jgi:hypothetical protein
MNVSDGAELSRDWRTRALLIGGLTGAIVGIISAIFYIRAAEETSRPGETPEAPAARDAVRLGLSLLGIMRTITEWGQRNRPTE